MERIMEIKVGDTVKLRKGVTGYERTPSTAVVRGFMKDVEGGLLMDRPLRGCRCWNVAHVERAARQVAVKPWKVNNPI